MIRKNILFIILFVPVILFGQIKNSNIVGPSIGFSFLGSTIQYGINYEYIFNLENNVKNNQFGIGGLFRIFGYRENFVNVTNDYIDILLGVQTNYHFALKFKKLDPFLGVAFAYDFGSAEIKNKLTSVISNDDSYGGFWIGAYAGLRYWFSNVAALNLRIGFGSLSYGALDIGLDYRLE